MRILFMGTPDFALFTLRALAERGENVVGVVTQPDKPRGRGYELTPPPVKVYAESVGIPVFQPATLRDGAFRETLALIDPELIVVVAYGKILPADVLEYPAHGCVNIHGSLLPKYRGAAPMQRAIMEGEAVTGVTIMYMAEGLDTGDMLAKAETPIAPEDNFETVHDRLGVLGAETLLALLPALEAGTVTRTVQDDALATYAAKISKEDQLLDFSAPAKCVHDRVRGLSPFPLSFTHTPDGKLLKILASVPDGHTDAAPGTVIATDGGFTVACGDGTALRILRVLPEGKPRMSAEDFVRGRRIKIGDLLS